MKKVSIIVPVYFNQDSLSLLGQEISKIEVQLLKKNLALELIFVDDGSKDESLKEIFKIKDKISNTKIIKLSKNFGSVSASKRGMSFVTGDCFLILAADLQDPPHLILEMVDEWLQGEKFIICARKSRTDPFITKILSSIYYKILIKFVLPSYPSGGFDLSLMDKQLLPYLKNASKNTNTPLYAFWLGFKPKVIEYNREERIHGKSKWTFSRKMKFFLDSILGFSAFPLRLMAILGSIVAFISFIFGTYLVIEKMCGNISVPGYTTLATLISFFSGIIIVMLGLIGEYLWRIFDQTNDKPESVIDEIYD